MAYFLQVSPPKPCMHISSPHTCYMPQQSHSPWFDHPHNIGWGIQKIKLLITLTFPLHYYVVSLRSKCLSHHPILELPPPMWPNVRPSFTPKENIRQNSTTRLHLFYRTPEHLSCRGIPCSARGDERWTMYNDRNINMRVQLPHNIPKYWLSKKRGIAWGCVFLGPINNSYFAELLRNYDIRSIKAISPKRMSSKHIILHFTFSHWLLLGLHRIDCQK